MRCADRNVDRLSGSHRDLLAVECHFRSAFNDEPVLCSLCMFLVAESLARQDLDSFHFETAIFLEHRVGSPRPAIKLPHTRSSLNLEWWNITEPNAVAPGQIFLRALLEDLTRRYRARFWFGVILGVCFQRQINQVAASLHQHKRRLGA